MASIGGNNNNRNNKDKDDKPHVDPFLEALKSADRLNKESHKVTIKKIDGIVKDFREYSKGFGIYKNATLKNQNQLIKSMDNNTKQLEKNLQSSQELIKSLNTFINAQKNNAVGANNTPKPTKGNKGSNTNASKENFDQKSRLERSILGDEVTGYLSAIKKDTGRIVELLEKGMTSNAPPPREGKKLDLKDMLGGGLMAALTAAMFAAENKKTGTQFHAAATAVPAIARTVAKVIEPVIDVAKSTKAVLGIRDAATAGRAAASIGQAATDARGKFTAKNIFMGEQKVGTLGKIGAAAGLGATYARYKEGDTSGAILQGISTALPLALAKTKFGKIANLASAGIDLGLLGRDKLKDDEAKLAKAEADKAQEPASQIATNTNETNVILREISNYFKGGGATENSASSFGGGALAMGALAVGGALLGKKAGIFSKLATPIADATKAGASTAGKVGGALQGAKFSPLTEAQKVGSKAPLLMGGAKVGATTAQAGASAGAKVGLGVGAKLVGKTALKAIPFVGLGMGAYGAYEKTKEGDYKGAALEAASGIASMIPVIGTAASIALQGVSATRDVMRATNEENLKNTNLITSNIATSSSLTNDQITKTTDNTANALITANGAMISANEATNKSVIDASNTVNGSLNQSSSTLTNMATTLASSLTGASNTFLGMIAKLTPLGMALTTTQKAAQYIFGDNAPAADSHAQGSALHSTRKSNMVSVYKSFLKAGMSESQAKAMTAEIGRENDFGNDLWKTHIDDANGKTNVGMMSWQNGRDKQLLAHLAKRGVLNKDGSIQRSQAALDAQAEFVMMELRGSHKSVGDKFLSNKNISYQDASKMLGKDYVKWAYTNEKYANGHKRRDAHYTNLNEELHKRGMDKVKQPTYISQKEFDKLSKAEARPTMVESQKVHDDWKKREAERVKKFTKVQSGILSGDIRVGTAPKVEKSNVKVPMAASTGGTSSSGADKQSGAKGAGANADYDLDKICAYAYSQAKEKSQSKCALYVRKALQQGDNKKQIAGGLGDASEWGKTLPKVGWVSVGNSQPRKGDIAHIPPNQYSKIGHVCIYTGSQWVSDFKQKSLNPYPTAVPYTLYRARSGYSNGSAIGSGDGTDFSDSGSGFDGGNEGSEDNNNPDNLIQKAGNALSEGVASIFNSEAMGELREFIKGDVYKRADNTPRPNAAGVFTKDTDEYDAKRQLRGNANNGLEDDLLGALGGDDVLRQQKHADYEKVKRIIGGTDEILRQQKHPDYDKIKNKLGGTNKILRQFDMGGKNAWIFNLLSQLGIGGDGILGEIIGVASGQKSIKDINLGNIIKIPNAPEGAFGGGFGGGLKQNADIDSTDLGTISSTSSDQIGDLASMGAVGGGFGGGLTETKGGSIVENADGTITHYQEDGRIVTMNKDGTIVKIERAGSVSSAMQTNDKLPSESSATSYAKQYGFNGGFGGGISYAEPDPNETRVYAGDNDEPVMVDPSMGNIGMAIDKRMAEMDSGIWGHGIVAQDPSDKQYEDQQMEMAKSYVESERKRSYEVMVQAPPSVQTPTNGGEARGKTPMDGLDSQLIVKNPDTIPHALAVAMLKNSM